MTVLCRVHTESSGMGWRGIASTCAVLTPDGEGHVLGRSDVPGCVYVCILVHACMYIYICVCWGVQLVCYPLILDFSSPLSNISFKDT